MSDYYTSSPRTCAPQLFVDLERELKHGELAMWPRPLCHTGLRLTDGALRCSPWLGSYEAVLLKTADESVGGITCDSRRAVTVQLSVMDDSTREVTWSGSAAPQERVKLMRHVDIDSACDRPKRRKTCGVVIAAVDLG